MSALFSLAKELFLDATAQAQQIGEILDDGRQFAVGQRSGCDDEEVAENEGIEFGGSENRENKLIKL